MNESNLEGIDAVLSDRLRELGLDYVANVLEGKQHPSESQLMFLRLGYAVPLRQQSGTLLIGGARDGDRIPSDLDHRRIQIPVPMTGPLAPRATYVGAARTITAQSYRREHIIGIDREFSFYLFNRMETDEGIQALFDNYRSPNSVENQYGQG